MQPIDVHYVRVSGCREVTALLAVHVKRRWKLEALVDLRHRVGREIVFEPPQMQLEHGGQRLERNPFLRILLAKSLRLVLILALQRLLLNVLVQRSVQIFATLHGHLQVVEILVASGHVLHVDAAQVVGELAAEQMRHGSLDASGLHLLLQLVHEHPVELLDVVLHESVVRVPTETFGQLLGAHARVAVLQLVENALKRQWDAILRILSVRGVHVVDSLPKVGNVRQRLEQRVHVASSALVL
mmetsp:Transcript_37895/g.96229  ORF Transcript_37895/g.96229 Transcript_37895/m.96229 type:complete len:242 (+) Transcript_37895:376-1101(+)